MGGECASFSKVLEALSCDEMACEGKRREPWEGLLVSVSETRSFSLNRFTVASTLRFWLLLFCFLIKSKWKGVSELSPPSLSLLYLSSFPVCSAK